MSTPQLPLGLRFPSDQRFEHFIGSPAIVALLSAIARGESSDWGFVSGPQGSGKTHLLIAACIAAEQAGRRARYMSLAALKGHPSDMLARLECDGLLALDDIDAALGDRQCELALFDLHNRMRAANAQLLYAATSGPAAPAPALPDLRSRLAQCTQITLAPLSEHERREWLRRRALARGFELDDAVLDYLFRRVGRDLGTLNMLLERIDRASLAAGRRVTVPFMRQLLEAAD